ncbi:arabinogalactan endo-1,4-beta-galactosidase [Spiroplasma turonicum]|nr:arabinogalactan endo-1,4-beta-galactosidase [Spiroplasma turonicum]
MKGLVKLMKNNKILIICFSIFATISIVISTFIAMFVLNKKDDQNYWYNNFYSNIKINNSSFIKGADVSSYAEVVEQMNHKSFEELSDDNQKIYIDDDGEYKNLFEILAKNNFNSIRLRLWNNPYDDKGNTYGGGHNDLETDIWITNQAKKFNIKNVLLDFHFSDFWADPNRQYLPKEWENYSTNELKNVIEKYTYNTLKTFYQKTGIVPKTTQLGNEITRGAFWSLKNNSKSGYKDVLQTADYLNYAASGVKTFESEFNVKTDLAIHIDGSPSITRWMDTLDEYLIKGKNVDWVDSVGITYYPDWNGNNLKLYNLMDSIKTKYNLKSYVSEYAVPYTYEQTNLVVDISSSQNGSGELANPSPDSQIKLTSSVMETISKANPDDETGFYWWEPAWIFSGKSGWSTREGIYYSEPNNESNQKSFMVGNSWWNRGIFDKNKEVLPVVEVVKNFSRIVKTDDYVVDANNFYNEKYLDYFNNDPIFNNTKLIGDYWKTRKNLINYIRDTNIILNSNNNIVEETEREFLSKNPLILKSQIKFINFEFDEITNEGSLQLDLSKNNVYYKIDNNITIKIKIITKYLDIIDFTNKSSTNKKHTIDIKNSDTNWLNKIYNSISKDNIFLDKLKNTILDKYNYQRDYYFKNDAPAFWDKEYNIDRWLRPWIQKNDEKIDIMMFNNIVEYETLNDICEWRDNLTIGEYDLIIYFTNDVNFELYGHENWKYLSTVAISVSVNVSS